MMGEAADAPALAEVGGPVPGCTCPARGSSPTRWDKFDILAKTLIGVAGLVLTIVLGIGEYNDRQLDDRIKTDQIAQVQKKESEAREAGWKEEFRAYYGLARQAKSDDPLVKSDLDLAGAIAQQLDAEFGDQNYLLATLALKGHFEKPGGNAASTNDASLQVGETAANPTVPVSNDQWFAVIGSYPVSDEGLKQAQEAAIAARKRGCAEIWKTKVSNNYALVFGGIVSRSIALGNAQFARKNGIAPDAFAQANREWARVQGC